MDENELSNVGNVSTIREEHPDKEAEPSNSANEAEVVPEAEQLQEAELLETEQVQKDECRVIATELPDSSYRFQLEAAIGDSQNPGHDSPIEGVFGGEFTDEDLRRLREQRLIRPEKEDLFRKFFDREYDQPYAPILERHRHNARVQRVRRRHLSESSISDPNLLGCLQDVGTSSGPILNQAGAIIGKNLPAEEIPDFQRFGTEFGQTLPLTWRIDGSDRSLGSIQTAPIGDIYGGTFSRPSSDDTRGLSPASSFPSFSSRPPTAASDSLKTSPPHDPECLEGDKSLLTAHASMKQEKPVRQRKLGIAAQILSARSESELAIYPHSADELRDASDEANKRKISKDMSVRSDPLPERKVSKDSSVCSYELMSLEDEAIIYPELSHAVESDPSLPIPDIDPVAVENLRQNVDDLTVSSDTDTNAVRLNVTQAENNENE